MFEFVGSQVVTLAMIKCFFCWYEEQIMDSKVSNVKDSSLFASTYPTQKYLALIFFLGEMDPNFVEYDLKFWSKELSIDEYKRMNRWAISAG